MADEPIEVALFPLGLVLFPGMALPLHIFEPRYRQMVSDCLADRAPFGLVLALPENEWQYEVPAPVGTLARIVDYERLPDGRFNLLALGTSRFAITSVRHDRPYATALVCPVRDIVETPHDLEMQVCRARNMLSTYLRLVLALVGDGQRQLAIPEDADELSYLIGTCLTCDDEEKQRILELRSVSERLCVGSALLRCELERLAWQVPAARATHADEDTSFN